MKRLLFLYLLPVILFAQQKFIIVTKEPIGFKEGKEFYKLGISLTEFEKKFGTPELKTVDEQETRWEYPNEGVTVIFDAEKNVVQYVITLTHAKTDKGIKSGNSRRDIEKIYGKPSAENSMDKFLRLRYQNLATEVLFDFTNGILEQVSVAKRNISTPSEQ